MTYEWVPIVISALFAYIVADCFIDVYGVRINSSLQSTVSIFSLPFLNIEIRWPWTPSSFASAKTLIETMAPIGLTT